MDFVRVPRIPCVNSPSLNRGHLIRYFPNFITRCELLVGAGPGVFLNALVKNVVGLGGQQIRVPHEDDLGMVVRKPVRDGLKYCCGFGSQAVLASVIDEVLEMFQ